MVKKIISSFMIIAMTITTLCTSFQVIAFASDSIKITVDGKTLSLDSSPFLENGRTYVPIRVIFEPLGYSVNYAEEVQKISCTKETATTKVVFGITLNDKFMTVTSNGYAQGDTEKINTVSLMTFSKGFDESNPIKIINGTTYLPTRVIAEALGCKVDWDGKSKTVVINSADAKIVPPDGWAATFLAFCEKDATDFVLYANDLIDMEKNGTINYDRSGGASGNSTVVQNAGDSPQNASNGNMPTSILIDGKLYTLERTKNDDGTESVAAIPQGHDGKKFYATLQKPLEPYNQKTYITFNYIANNFFEYVYKEPITASATPVVGSVPANIVLDVKKSTELFLEIPGKPYEAEVNVTEAYSTGDYGGCEWYAGGRFCEVYGIPIRYFKESPTKKIFDADTMLDMAEKFEQFTVIRDVNDIRDNSIVVLGIGKDGVGHVGFVEYVERDSSGNPINVYYSEGNMSADGKYHHGIDGAIQKASFSSFLKQGGKPVIGYIIPNADYYN